jgi:anthranilate/para-aminobenzoate synthase component I
MENLILGATEAIRPLYAELSYKPPVNVFEAFSGKGAIFLDSPRGPENTARYSFVLFEPYREFKVKNGSIEVRDNKGETVLAGRPLSLLRQFLNFYRQIPLPELPPFQGGIAGLLSYDFVHYLERLPRTVVDDLMIPDAHFFFYDRLFVFDNIQGKAYAIVCPGARDPGEKNLLFKAEEALQDMIKRYDHIKNNNASGYYLSKEKKVEIVKELTKGEYMDMVKAAKAYIKAGDIFQANLSQRIWAPFDESLSWSLYLRLRSINPSPFCFYADMGEYILVSSSPERLLRLQGRVAETRPIAGTRPRGANRTEDEAMRIELLLNEKERAEHIMLIDLERNDLGKVCEYGTVHVDELMITEDYSHVIHIVSNVKGILAQPYDAFSLIRAAFPGGTITGVPKVRCMEIIDELEPVARGPYTGSFGYIGFNGNMDINIIIRTFVIKDGKAFVQAGAGVVADSDPEREYYETLKKAEALLLSIEGV